MSSLKALPSSPKAYRKAFEVFLRHSTARQAILECITTWGAEAMTKWSTDNVTNRSFTNNNLNDKFRVLGIGSGSGQVDFVILETIASHLQGLSPQPDCKGEKVEIFAKVIEPNPEELNSFKTNACSSLPPTLKHKADVSFEWEQKSFQEYSCQDTHPKNFNFIHFVHSLYYMDAETALLHCYENELGENGVIFSLVQTAKSYFPQMMKKFQHQLKFGPDDVVFYTTDELMPLAKKHQWKYDCRAFPFKVDITKCFDETSVEGNLLLDFVSHQENFRAMAGRELHHDMVTYLTEMSSVDESGARYLTGEMGVLIIYKN